MPNNQPVFWKTRDGKLISVDEMDINHLRNVLKMIIRNREKAIQLLEAKSKPKVEFKLNGDIAQSFINDMQDAEMEEDLDDGMLYWRKTQT
jgi:hypothetical protein